MPWSCRLLKKILEQADPSLAEAVEKYETLSVCHGGITLLTARAGPLQYLTSQYLGY